MTIAPIAGAYTLPHRGGRGSFLVDRGPVGRGGRDHFHRGIDLEAELGRPWLAVENGTVELVHKQPARGFYGYGRIVVLKLDSGPWALYAHGSQVDVAPGQRVAEGEQLGRVGRSQFRGGDPGDDQRMGSHLHFELSKRRYPLPPEAPVRVDPTAWLKARGVAQSRAADPDEAAAPPSSPSSPSSEPAPLARAPRNVGPSLREELMRRVVETDLRVAEAARLLDQRGAGPLAAIVRERWASSRGALLATLAGPTSIEEARASVSSWLDTVREARSYLVDLPDEVVRRAGDAWTVAQHELWTRGQWMLDQAEAAAERVVERVREEVQEHVIDPATNLAIGTGAVLVLVGLVWLWSSSRSSRSSEP